MFRTQIQLTEHQAEQLRLLAARRKVSRAKLVREAVESWLSTHYGVSPEERKQRAMAAVGKFASGRHDVSEQHDRYLDEAYRD